MLNDRANQVNQIGVLYRQGDVFLKRIPRLPIGAQRREGATLAHGELTGHSHRLRQANTVQLWAQGIDLFLEVKTASATLVQREYRPDAYVEVMD